MNQYLFGVVLPVGGQNNGTVRVRHNRQGGTPCRNNAGDVANRGVIAAGIDWAGLGNLKTAALCAWKHDVVTKPLVYAARTADLHLEFGGRSLDYSQVLGLLSYLEPRRR